MWDWFFSNEVWVIIGSVVVLIFLLLSFSRQIKKDTDEKNKVKPTKGKVLGLGLWASVSVSLFFLVMALIVSALIQRGTDIKAISVSIQNWFIDSGISILVIILVSFIIYQIVKSTMPHLIERSVKRRHAADELEMGKRAQTLNHIIVSTLGITILVTAILMILAEIAPNITPLLAGAGIAGIAIGFGAQSLVKDVLNGVFIILEDQYRRGDVVSIAGLSGMVEDLSLRRTVLRDVNGTVHTIPNGQVTTASNMTKEWSRVNIDIAVPYYEDPERVMAIINKVGVELTEDPKFKSMIITAPCALYINDLSDKGIIIKVLGETKPLKQWDVAGEFRRRLKIAFDAEKIAIPWAYGGVFTSKKSEPDTLQCNDCGFPNPPANNFCANCGATLKQTKKQHE